MITFMVNVSRGSWEYFQNLSTQLELITDRFMLCVLVPQSENRALNHSINSVLGHFSFFSFYHLSWSDFYQEYCDDRDDKCRCMWTMADDLMLP